MEGDILTLSRDTRSGRSGYGKDVPPRRIPLAAVSGVRLKEATRLMNGWLQVLAGGVNEEEPKFPYMQPSVVTFTYKQQDDFKALHRLLLDAVSSNKEQGVDFPSVEYDPSQASKAQQRTERFEARRAEYRERYHPAPTLPEGRPSVAVYKGMSHEGGRNAEVVLYEDRIEREKAKKRSALISAPQDVEVTLLRNVTSVETKRDGVAFTKLIIYAVGNNIEFRFSHKDAATFRDAITNLLRRGDFGGAMQSVPSHVAVAPKPDLAEELRKLAGLRDEGLLTDEEFAEQKRRLLAP